MSDKKQSRNRMEEITAVLPPHIASEKESLHNSEEDIEEEVEAETFPCHKCSNASEKESLHDSEEDIQEEVVAETFPCHKCSKLNSYGAVQCESCDEAIIYVKHGYLDDGFVVNDADESVCDESELSFMDSTGSEEEDDEDESCGDDDDESYAPPAKRVKM